MATASISLSEKNYSNEFTSLQLNNSNNLRKVNTLDYIQQTYGMELKDFIAAWINGESLCSQVPDLINFKMKRIVNSLRFWSGRFRYLKHDKFLLITTFSLEDNVRISYGDILRNLEKVTSLDVIDEIYVPENKNYIGLYFKTAEICEKMKDIFKRVDEAAVINISWYEELLQITGRLHYVPPFIEQHEVGMFLSKYLFNVKLQKLSISDYKNLKFNSSVIAFTGTLKSGLNLDFIPHFTSFSNNEVLVSIRGRPPMCTKCRCKGHTRRECSYHYCMTCRTMSQKDHGCEGIERIDSYASIIKKNNDYYKNNSSSEEKNKEKNTKISMNGGVITNEVCNKVQTDGNIMQTRNINGHDSISIDQILPDKSNTNVITIHSGSSQSNTIGNLKVDKISKVVENKSEKLYISKKLSVPLKLKTLCELKLATNNDISADKGEAAHSREVECKAIMTYSKANNSILVPDGLKHENSDLNIFSVESFDLHSSDSEADQNGDDSASGMDMEISEWRTVKRKLKAQNSVKEDLDIPANLSKHVKIEGYPIKMENRFEVLS